MNKRLLTLDDLYNYYSSKVESAHFSSNDTNENIVVQVNGHIDFKANNNSTEGLLPVTLQSCHIYENKNGSYISRETMEKAMPSFSNRPILGYIHNVDGENEFYDHRMHLDDDGNLIYDEIPVGIIPESCNARLEYDEEKQHDYVVVDGYIFEEYTEAANIMKKKKQCSVSVELSIRELAYDAEDKKLLINDFFFSGVTILGKTPEGDTVLPGMEKANITLADFSAENNSVVNDKLIETLEKLNDTLKSFDINSTRKEDYDSMSENEELETVEETSEVVEGEMVTETDTEVEATESETDTDADVDINYAVTVNSETKNFSLSLNSKLYALQQLVNETYCDDGDYYSVEVYEDDNMLEMHGWFNSYRQTYKCKKKCEYSLTGDRVAIFAKYLTQDEIDAFERMKANYSINETKLAEVTEKLAKYEAEPEKMDILNSSDYSQITECEEYKTLVNDHFDLSIDDVRAKADAILLNFAKTHTVVREDTVERKQFASVQKSGRYGNIFTR